MQIVAGTNTLNVTMAAGAGTPKIPTITLASSTYNSGGTLDFTLTGFAAIELVTLVIENTSLSQTAFTDEDGNANGSIGVFGSSGKYTLTATDTSGNTASVPFTIVAGAGTLAGKVSDYAGPISGVSVSLTGYSGTTGSYSGTTGSDGRYLISNIPTGNYIVAFNRSGYFNGQLITAILANSTSTLDETLITTANVGTIRGQITRGDTGAGIAGVNVEIDAVDGSRSITAYTDGNGNYIAANQPVGRYSAACYTNSGLFGGWVYNETLGDIVVIELSKVTIYNIVIAARRLQW
jgi:hypothetical protein